MTEDIPWNKILILYGIIAGVIILAGGIPYAFSSNFAEAGPENPKGSSYDAYDYYKDLNATKNYTKIHPLLLLSTDRSSYHFSEKLYLSGYVGNIIPNQDVTIRMLSPVKNLIGVAQFTPDYHGNFTKLITLSGPLWNVTGTYTILGYYGSHIQSNATFYFDKGLANGCGASQIHVVEQGGYMMPYCITYSITGGSNIGIYDMVVDIPHKHIFFNMDSGVPGYVTLVLPREVLDSKNGTFDTNFIVMKNFRAITIEDISRIHYRELTLPFNAGNTQFDIYGTSVIPEFPVGWIVLVSVFAGVILLGRLVDGHWIGQSPKV